MNKSIFHSRTFWANAITTLISVGTAIGGQEWVASHPQAVAGIGASVGILNILLRVITTEPVSFD